MRGAVLLPFILLACAPDATARGTSAPVPVTGHPDIFYLPETRMRGPLTLGFEVSSFDRCWLEMTRAAARQLYRLAPEIEERGPHFFRVLMIGRRTPGTEGHFGHLGAYPCQVQAVRFLSVRRDRRR